MMFERVRISLRGEMSRPRRFTDIAGCVAVLVVVNLLVAFTATATRQWPIFTRLMFGPLSGWIGAFESHAYPGALQLLLPATVLTVFPLGVYAVGGYRAALFGGTVFWFISGCVFCLGIGA